MTTPRFLTTPSDYSKLSEGVLKAIMEAVAPLATGEDKLLDAISEGEEILGEYKSQAMIVLGPDNIDHHGMRELLHKITVWICYLSKDVSEKGVLKKLRNIAGHGYDLIMEDITLGQTVLKAIPRRVEPGFVRVGEDIFVGVMQTWEIWKTASFTV